MSEEYRRMNILFKYKLINFKTIHLHIQWEIFLK